MSLELHCADTATLSFRLFETFNPAVGLHVAVPEACEALLVMLVQGCHLLLHAVLLTL